MWHDYLVFHWFRSISTWHSEWGKWLLTCQAPCGESWLSKLGSHSHGVYLRSHSFSRFLASPSCLFFFHPVLLLADVSSYAVSCFFRRICICSGRSLKCNPVAPVYGYPCLGLLSSIHMEQRWPIHYNPILQLHFETAIFHIIPADLGSLGSPASWWWRGRQPTEMPRRNSSDICPPSVAPRSWRPASWLASGHLFHHDDVPPHGFLWMVYNSGYFGLETIDIGYLHLLKVSFKTLQWLIIHLQDLSYLVLSNWIWSNLIQMQSNPNRI